MKRLTPARPSIPAGSFRFGLSRAAGVFRAVGISTVLWLAPVGLVLAQAAATSSSGARPSSAATAASLPWSSWRALRLQARQMLFFYGQVDMKVRDQDGREILETQTRATFLGAELASSRTITTIDKATGRTLDYTEMSRKRASRYIFGAEGYSVEKLRTPKEGPGVPLEKWRTLSRKDFPYPTAAAGSGSTKGHPKVFDYYGMILYLQKAKLERPGDEVILHVATSHGPEPFRIGVSEERRSERDIEDIATGQSRKIPVRELRLRVSPVGATSGDEGFMKMEGETEIWVEAGTRTLLEIDGKIPRVPGRVEVELAAIE